MKLWGLRTALGLTLAGWISFAAALDKKTEARVFELRTYHSAPGKMKALHARFRDHTNKLFEKHGMTVIGFWNPIDPDKGEQTFVYFLAFPSKETAKKSWQAFRDDPEWQAVREASEQQGKLVDKVESVYLNPTDYSPLKEVETLGVCGSRWRALHCGSIHFAICAAGHQVFELALPVVKAATSGIVYDGVSRSSDAERTICCRKCRSSPVAASLAWVSSSTTRADDVPKKPDNSSRETLYVYRQGSSALPSLPLRSGVIPLIANKRECQN